MLDILQLVRQVGTDIAIDYALDHGWKVVELERKVTFTKDSEIMSIYFSDNDKSSFLRAFLGEITSEQTSDSD